MRLGVFIAVAHLLGAGHLTRAAAIGRALAAAGHHVTLVSGGTPTPLVTATGMTFVQLPPVRATVDDFTTLLDPDGRPVGPDHLARRREVLLDAFAEARPDVVVTEHFPFGRRVLAPEFGALLDAARDARPRPIVLASIRDVLVAPDKAAKVVATHDIVTGRYDGVLVHGDEHLLPLDLSWPVDETLRPKLIYTGYVGPDEPMRPDSSEGQTVLVSGGSSAAALPLYRTAIEAAATSPLQPWHLLIGPGVTEADFQSLAASAPANAAVERGRTDFRDLLAKAAVFVGQAGYNTVMDIVATQVRAVLVPFERGRETEQRLRADGLGRCGFATILPEDALTADALARAAADASVWPKPDMSSIRLEGARGTVAAIERLAVSRASAGAAREGAHA